MAKILFATMPITGHVNPGLPIARKLVENGHEVGWYTGTKFRNAIESTGARFFQCGDKVDFDDANLEKSFPDRKKYKAIEQLKYDLKRIFTDHVPHSTREILELLKSFEASVIVADTAFGTGPMVYQLGGPPCIAFGITALPLASNEVAPFGLGLLPDNTPFGTMRNRFLEKFASNVLFKDIIDYRNKVRAQFNLAPDMSGLFDGMIKGSVLYLQGTVSEFEYPRSNMPDNVRFIGPLLPTAPAHVQLPDWWNEMVNTDKPVVHVSQGTIATDPYELIIPTIYGLADMDVLTIVSSKTLPDGMRKRLPANVRVADFLPYSELMQHVDVYVTNGGYGGVHYALAEGVPIVVAGTTEDKPEVSNRIQWSGAGINLKCTQPSSLDVRLAVKKILRRGSYKEAAARISKSIKKQDAATEAAKLIAQVAVENETTQAKRKAASAR